MVDINTLEPGMRVKIVDRWGANCREVDEMDKYLGQVVTISKVYPRNITPYCLIKEDDQEWCWVGNTMECVVFPEDEGDYQDQTEILSFINSFNILKP